MSELQYSIHFAKHAHGDVLDKNGQPFIGHPLRVMAAVSSLSNTDIRMCAAVLHDVLEDSSVTEASLRSYFDDCVGVGPRFASRIVDLVLILTRREESYFEYIARCAANEDARLIKIADIQDNMLPSRQWGGESMKQRYQKALGILGVRVGGPE